MLNTYYILLLCDGSGRPAGPLLPPDPAGRGRPYGGIAGGLCIAYAGLYSGLYTGAGLYAGLYACAGTGQGLKLKS